MNRIGICTNLDKDPDLVGTCRVIKAISGKAEVLVAKELREKLICCSDVPTDGVRFADEDQLYSMPGALIVLGGDGTILKAARRCAQNGVPIIGINLGRIGYMAELELDELSLLEGLFTNSFNIERRMMIEAQIGDERIFALNDAVIGAESIFRMIEIELYCDGKLVNRYRSDGLIASTPTGSTAYSLSAGGAVIDPRMNAIMFTPICSHSLNASSLVFSAETELVMKNVTKLGDKLYLSIDGSEMREIEYGREVAIRRSPLTVSFIRLKDGSFYDVLRHKMA